MGVLWEPRRGSVGKQTPEGEFGGGDSMGRGQPGEKSQRKARWWESGT